MDSNRDLLYAKRIINHYITMTMRAAGLRVDSDTTAELEAAIDSLISAAVIAAEVNQDPVFEEHEQRIDDLVKRFDNLDHWGVE